MKLQRRLVFLMIWFLALGLRLYGINWDQGQHLHPDERFLTMVATDISLPHSIGEYFDGQKSPLNPYNYQQYQFFVYGTLPMFVTKAVAVVLDMDNYEQLVLVGRGMSAITDSLNVWWIFALGGWMGALVYAVMVLPLQLAHFWAVDTFVTFFLGVALWTGWQWTKRRQLSWMILTGVVWGLALASKITAVYFAPIIGLLLVINLRKDWRQTVAGGLVFGIMGMLVFRICQPYVFVNEWQIEPRFVANLKELTRLSTPSIWFPPSIQWIGKTRWLFPFQNIVLWGLGLGGTGLFVLGLKGWVGGARLGYMKWLLLGWIVGLWLVQGAMPAHTMRYFLPIYPALAIVAGQARWRWGKIFLIGHLVWGLAFLGIYQQEHSRVQASRWIDDNVWEGAVISAEYWDDALPLAIGENQYTTVYLEVFAPDSIEKWQRMGEGLEMTDYVAMSSNRAWGSVGKLPDLFPESVKYYSDWFANREDLVYQRQVYPNISWPMAGKCLYLGPTDYPGKEINWLEIKSCDRVGLYIRDDMAEEAFTVYDHPQVFIWRNRR